MYSLSPMREKFSTQNKGNQFNQKQMMMNPGMKNNFAKEQQIIPFISPNSTNHSFQSPVKVKLNYFSPQK